MKDQYRLLRTNTTRAALLEKTHLESPLPVGKDVVVIVDHTAAHAVIAARHHAAWRFAGSKRLLVRLGTGP